jgi:ACT domain-containing protein
MAQLVLGAGDAGRRGIVGLASIEHVVVMVDYSGGSYFFYKKILFPFDNETKQQRK